MEQIITEYDKAKAKYEDIATMYNQTRTLNENVIMFIEALEENQPKDMIITDYSSVVFDVAYQYKPIMCYQFDKELFEKGQYAKGYFDWETSNLLKQTTNLNGLLKLIKQEHRNKYQIDPETKKAIDEFFPIRDNKNCERVYNFIKNN